MTIRYATLSQCGRRPVNEDAFRVSYVPEQERWMGIVCDGMGGYAMGEMASDIVITKWLRENLASIRAGKGPLRLCWWRGLTHYVVNLETHHYRLLSDWSNILTDDGEIPFCTSLRCKRNSVRSRLTVHYTDKDGHEGMLKIDEKLNIICKT